MRKLKMAAILMIIHGAFIEFLSSIGTLVLIISQSGEPIAPDNYFSFVVPYFDKNMELMLIAGIIFGIIRTIGAIAVLKNRMWGFVLSGINCAVTLLLLIFMLPVGIMDGILSGTALILMLTAFFGKQEIIHTKSA